MPVDLSLSSAALITLAGGAAGFVNSIVGSGTLISFPTLVGVGYGETVANITNNVGLVPGSFSAAAAQRRELVGQRHRLVRLVPCSAVGGVIGALLLFVLPESYFRRIVPFLVLVGVALVVLGPRIQRWVRSRPSRVEGAVGVPLMVAVTLTGVYGGYFGAAQGVIVVGLLGAGVGDTLPRVNAAKNVMVGTVNAIAAGIFILHGGVVWRAAALVAAGSTAGGIAGSRVGRRIPATWLRGVIVVVGVVAAATLLADW